MCMSHTIIFCACKEALLQLICGILTTHNNLCKIKPSVTKTSSVMGTFLNKYLNGFMPVLCELQPFELGVCWPWSCYTNSSQWLSFPGICRALQPSSFGSTPSTLYHVLIGFASSLSARIVLNGLEAWILNVLICLQH